MPDYASTSMWRSSGIVDLGYSVPDLRVACGPLAAALGSFSGPVTKSVPAEDEDSATLAFAAAADALGDHPADEVGAVWVGSETKPHAVRPIAVTVASLLGATPAVGVVDLEFACRGAVEGLWGLLARIECGELGRALLIGADCAHADLDDPLVYSTGAAAAAALLGPAERAAAVVSRHVTRITDTPDFWRRDGATVPSHGNRFTGEPGYFAHQESAAAEFFRQTGTGPNDYRYAVFHQPNRKFVERIAERVGFHAEQYGPAMFVDSLGNCYAANVLLGLCMIWDQLEEGDTVFVSAYGSGAGADAFAIRATARHAPAVRSPRRLCPAAGGFEMSVAAYLARRALTSGGKNL